MPRLEKLSEFTAWCHKHITGDEICRSGTSAQIFSLFRCSWIIFPAALSFAKLRDRSRFTARAMFGESALYADGKVVALICDDLLQVKILPASNELHRLCEKGEPYPGAKPHYVVEEGQLSTIENLPAILSAVAKSIPEKKTKAKRKRAS